MNGDQILVKHAKALEADVDGQRVLMSPKDYAYFGLVDTGALVWDRIDGETPFDELVTSLATEFDTDVEQVRNDVDEFVSALNAAGLLAEV